MSFRRGGFRQRNSRKRSLGNIVDSIKNIGSVFTASATGVKTIVNVAIAKDSPVTANVTEVKRGSKIFRIWLEIWIYASAEAVAGITHGIDFYIYKDPGANLTPPIPGTTGSSNEKKFIFKTWKGLIGARTQGSAPYTWKGWIRIPKIYQRMGTDDRIDLVFQSTGVNAILCTNTIYKWFS